MQNRREAVFSLAGEEERMRTLGRGFEARSDAEGAHEAARAGSETAFERRGETRVEEIYLTSDKIRKTGSMFRLFV